MASTIKCYAAPTAEEVTAKNGTKYNVYKLGYDRNGISRYFISYLSLGLKSPGSTSMTKMVGLRKYTHKSLGNGFVFQSQNLNTEGVDVFEEFGFIPNSK